MLGISRGPLREAMRRLESEGLLVAEPHKGTRVAVISPEEVIERYTIRGLLEGYAASTALKRIRAEKIPLMAAELGEFGEVAQSQNWALVAELDTRWHRHLITALGNKRLEETWARNNGPLRAILAVAATRAPRTSCTSAISSFWSCSSAATPPPSSRLFGSAIWSVPSAWLGSSGPGKRGDRSVYRR